MEIDSAARLSIVANVAAPDPAAATLPALATLHMDASAIAHLRPGGYQFDVIELTAPGTTHLRHMVTVFLDRTVGRSMVE
ncbi:hypothetical protein [Aureliella helgolandensis]|uniref:hypothetical protein n=1 Tax=Aureliella helgolandensis TaxID=2527968 RepID=UPI0011A88EFE|nr:hypothetical protein [Aureliella helgolandensis]